MNAPSKRPPLPDAWVERIFDRMQGLYGSLWLDRWRSGEMVAVGETRFDRGLLLAKATWGQELAGFADESGAARIARALESCSNRAMPPTLPEFLGLCRQGIANEPLYLADATPASPETKAKAEQAFAKMADGRVDGAGYWEIVLDKHMDGSWKVPDYTVKCSFEALMNLGRNTSRWDKIKPDSIRKLEAKAA